MRACALLVACMLSTQAIAFHLEETTIADIHQAIQAGELTCSELMQQYLARIKTRNLSMRHAKAPINAFTEINRSLFDTAKALDQHFATTKKLQGPLHCIPVVLKDNIDSMDTTTSAGSFALLGNQPVQDAFLVKRLRRAGAVIIGKGGMDEFAWGMYGINSRNGRVGNAYDTAKNPGGSSSGVGAAISANFGVIGIGTDNSGSVRIPAVFNGLVGLRPGTGLISQHGIFPMGNLDATAGPMTRTTTDLAKTLDVIAAADTQDKQTWQPPRPATYTTYLDARGLQGKRIGVVQQVGTIMTFKAMPKDIMAVFDHAYGSMRVLGATIIDVALPDFVNERYLNQAGEIEDVNAYLAAFPAARKDFADICYSDRTRTFGQPAQCIIFTNTVAAKFSKPYKRMLTVFKKNRELVYAAMVKFQLDALLIPISNQGSASYDGKAVNTWQAPVSSNSGLPAIAFTVGYDKAGMPIGLELIGKQNQEGMLIGMAYAYETAAPPRTPPVLPPPDLTFVNVQIPALNHLITLLGVSTYEKILKTADPNIPEEKILTPERFKAIALDVMKQFKHDAAQ